jgi:hypothetical protein
VVTAKWLAGDGLVAEVCCSTPPSPGTPARFSIVRYRPDQAGGNGAVLVDGLTDPFPASYDSAIDVAGSTVLYSVSNCRAGTSSAWVIDGRGGTERQVSDASSAVYGPRLSPDGAMAAWVRSVPAGSEIDVAPLGSAAQAVLTGAAGVANLTWSPDGGSLTFDVVAQQPTGCFGG